MTLIYLLVYKLTYPRVLPQGRYLVLQPNTILTYDFMMVFISIRFLTVKELSFT